MKCKYCDSEDLELIAEHRDIVKGRIIWIRSYHCNKCKRNFTKTSNS